VLIPMEERELAERFGPAYEEYRRRVPAIFPRLVRAARR
jgi:protein-S-isoprenylcysteine O-methyltransferase Ste14